MLFSMKLFKQLSLSIAVSASALSINSYAVLVEPQVSPSVEVVIPSPGEVKSNLINKLNKINYLSGNFVQDVLDEEGNALQQGRGTLAIAKPNQVRWHTQEPDETLIVSDGSTLWFFDPFIEQVSAHTLADAIANTPILLLTNNNKALWDNYDVIQAEPNRFEIITKDPNSQVKSLTLVFDNKSLSALAIKDSTGQISHIRLLNVNDSQAPDAKSFQFTVPEGVALDDQR